MTRQLTGEILYYLLWVSVIIFMFVNYYKQTKVTNRAKTKLDKIVSERETRTIEKKATEMLQDYHNLLAEFIKSQEGYNYHPQNQLLIAKQLTEISSFIKSCVYSHLLEEEINKQ